MPAKHRSSGTGSGTEAGSAKDSNPGHSYRGNGGQPGRKNGKWKGGGRKGGNDEPTTKKEALKITERLLLFYHLPRFFTPHHAMAVDDQHDRRNEIKEPPPSPAVASAKDDDQHDGHERQAAIPRLELPAGVFQSGLTADPGADAPDLFFGVFFFPCHSSLVQTAPRGSPRRMRRRYFSGESGSRDITR
jgi:hypothetical protein